VAVVNVDLVVGGKDVVKGGWDIGGKMG